MIPISEINKQFKNIEVRKIPNKRMPSVNSPSNVSGVKSPTMTNEFIVIMTKLAQIQEKVRVIINVGMEIQKLEPAKLKEPKE